MQASWYQALYRCDTYEGEDGVISHVSTLARTSRDDMKVIKKKMDSLPYNQKPRFVWIGANRLASREYFFL